MSDRDFTSRYIVGIDLGTTNCSVSYVDQVEETPCIRDFAILQTVAPGETGKEPLLPSFCYLPGESELPEGALALPWKKRPSVAVGRFAREQGGRIPQRLVASAKSWLAHSGVDRTRPILPWGGDLGEQMISPVQASSFYLEHILKAWNHQFRREKDWDGTPCLLENQQVILTVPASFDETARELTVQAATAAGIRHLTLIEEPMAACYAWLARHQEDWKDHVHPGDIILVADVGGGTTDLTLIEVEDNSTLRRKAVGDHLLLGGDNMDMTLAHVVEQGWNTTLSQHQWTQLCQECRRAKELLLSPCPPPKVTITLQGQGSSILASSRHFDLTAEDIQDAIVNGFFPEIPVDAPLPERRRGLQAMGLPYASDPAVTRHVLAFLKSAGQTLSTPQAVAIPTKVLFNGGTMIPSVLRQRLLDTVRSWHPSCTPEELAADDFSLAVSRGAASYGLARQGHGLRIKGGIARAYFLEVAQDNHSELLCVMPRDTEEGVTCQLDRHFTLQANTPVAFPLHASSTRLQDNLGDMITDRQDMTALPMLKTTLKVGKKGTRTALNVRLSSRLNEIGTLDLWCESTESSHRFPLSFDLRSVESAQEGIAETSTTTVDESQMSLALSWIQEAFEQAPKTLKDILTKIESALELPRTSWNAAFLRNIADLLLSHPEWRTAMPEAEARWLNLAGFALRPGCGMVGDDLRIRTAWKLWKSGPMAPANPSVRQNWFIFWRRLSGGLTAGQQDQLGGSLARELLSKDGAAHLKKGDQCLLEAWRCIASMERTTPAMKLKCLRALLAPSGKLPDDAFWLFTRLAARKLLHGSEDNIVPAEQLKPLAEKILSNAELQAKPQSAQMAVAAMATPTGVRTIDLPEDLRDRAIGFLVSSQASKELLELAQTGAITSALQENILGDALPLGIALS